MSQLSYFILIPFLGYFISLLLNPKNEKAIFGISVGTVILNIILFFTVSLSWISKGFNDLYFEGPALYKSSDYSFNIDLFFDHISATYFFVASILTMLVMFFSRYYIHREKGFKRFFVNVLFFYFGLTTILFSGNFETLLIGWEIIGMSSFFLIGFYRERYLPVKNALKVFSLYRLADVFLIFGMWICHHYFHKNITFWDLKNHLASNTVLITDNNLKIIIPLIFLVVAMIKSAQFPFSSWLPRAMEGPTTSSAIFYGSLSVHIGIFLMLRTYPFWSDNLTFKILLGSVGLLTAIITTFIARVQSTVKTQIAYSSISQIGIMFIEVALGFHTLALVHFASNAFLRTYQLLVSPSVLSYLIHDQFFNFVTPQHNFNNTFIGKLKTSIYILSIKEWNLDSFMYGYLWKPLKNIGNSINFINYKIVTFILTPLYLLGLYFVYHKDYISGYVNTYFPILIASISVAIILKAFVKRNEASKSWFLIIVSQFYSNLAIAFNDNFEFSQMAIYLSGILFSGVLGYFCFNFLNKHKESTTLNKFHGHIYEHPRLAMLFLVACLGLAGFPITPTFVGEDIVLIHIHENQLILAFLVYLTIFLDGVSIFRIYSRLFLGPHEKQYHEIAYRSS